MLKCAKHKICQTCFPEHIAKFGADEMYKCPASECAVAVAPPPPIWIYVDNSNIWIGAKYLSSKVKKFKSSQDHRVRISVGKLTDVVAKKRRVGKGTLYGSEPPQIDSVWEKIRKQGWEVKTKEKSYLTHKEKEVDAQLLVDVTEKACTTPPNERSTIVLITGDSDMRPAVEKIMEYEGWKVEIYMWQDSLSDRLKQLSKTNEDVTCEPLDDHMMDVVFTNKKFPATHGTIPKDSSAVLTIEPGAFPKHVIVDTWWNELESIAQWPVQYWWIIRNKEETNDLLLVFSHLGEKMTYDVSNFVQKLNDHDDSDEPVLPHVQRAETYFGYNRRLKEYEAIVKHGNFTTEDLGSESNFLLHKFSVVKRNVFQRHHVVDDNPTTPNTSTGDAKFRAVPPTLVGGRPVKCRFGKNCIRGVNCEFTHSDGDKVFFEGNSGRGNPFRKTRMCKKYPSCPKSIDWCNYAHGDRDGWCLNCRQHGHFSKTCPNQTQ